MRRGWVYFVPMILSVGSLHPAWSTRAADVKSVAGKESEKKPDFSKQIVPILNKYCSDCHSGTKPKGKVAFDCYKDEPSALKNGVLWDKISQRLIACTMPPKSRPQPTPEEKTVVLNWVEQAVNQTGCLVEKDPGRVTMRRLNRAEYNNTIRDLLGVEGDFTVNFPMDDVGYGFDNIGDVLSMPPILMEKYLAAADTIVAKVMETPDAKKRLFFFRPDDKHKGECTHKILDHLATRAYRRPVTEDELRRLTKLVELAEKKGDSFEASVGLALKGVLVSPNFLFRVELDRGANNAKAARPVDEFELASRLSYFLWSSMPDEELFVLARKGALRKDGNLEAQAKRMLKDSKSRALVENFAGQWLQLRRLKTMTPDTKQFKEFNGELRNDMLKETELFFASVMREDHSVLEFLDADYTFLNERLAKFYEIEGVKGPEFRKVQLTGDQRGGVLTMASILTITSNPTRTSPVKRGKWILENLLNAPLPPPPPDAGELSEKKSVVESASLRQRMEQHRKNPNCAVCHDRMDPIGFALENYDAVGKWRTKDGAFDIDPAGELPDGKAFKNPKELKTILKGRDREFCRCLSDRMLTYSIGRGLESYDKCSVDQIADELKKNNFHFSSLVISIVKSEPFQMQRATESAKKNP